MEYIFAQAGELNNSMSSSVISANGFLSQLRAGKP